jgi:hypothetical protein
MSVARQIFISQDLQKVWKTIYENEQFARHEKDALHTVIFFKTCTWKHLFCSSCKKETYHIHGIAVDGLNERIHEGTMWHCSICLYSPTDYDTNILFGQNDDE